MPSGAHAEMVFAEDILKPTQNYEGPRFRNGQIQQHSVRAACRTSQIYPVPARFRS